ncbi:MAG: L-threonylcarbamoyladenylate synthase [Defluviitaleaceae bacterium]|nr:L-threonylcarbamoyladenylate synthase [Defluviitaleaceae bacterium]
MKRFFYTVVGFRYVLIMNTKILTANQLDICAGIIKEGGIVAIPTETVYGLAADAFNPTAINKIFTAKGRPNDNPLIVHISKKTHLTKVAADIPPIAHKYMEQFWPGPLTLVLKKHPALPAEALAGLPTVGVRLPDHPVALELISLCGPLVAPSANLSGKPSPTTAWHVMDDLAGKIDAVVDAGPTNFGLESTVIDAETGKILRPGAVTENCLSAVRPVFSGLSFTRKEINTPTAPGQKYTHYAPKAKTTLVVCKEPHKKILHLASNTVNKKNLGILTTDQNKHYYEQLGATVLSLGNRDNPQQMATLLYSHLRQFDTKGVKHLFIEGFLENHGFYLTIMDRLIKAASYDIVK